MLITILILCAVAYGLYALLRKPKTNNESNTAKQRNPNSKNYKKKGFSMFKSVSFQHVVDLKSFKPTSLVIDCETTGLIIDNSIRITKKNIGEFPENFPKIVQIALVLIDDQGNYTGEKYYIKQSTEIPKEAVKIHGITTDFCNENGIELKEALTKVNELAAQVDDIIGYNVNFDYKVISAEFTRENIPNSLKSKNRIDVMKLCSKYLFDNKPGYKISLENSVNKIISKFVDLSKFKKHDAESDAFLTAILYLYLKS